MSRRLSSFNLLLLPAAMLLAAQTSTLETRAEVKRDDSSKLSYATRLPLHKWQNAEAKQLGIVTLTHGLASHSMTLERLATELAREGFTVVALDLRGHGYWKSDLRQIDDDRLLDCRRSVDDLVLLLDQLRLENPTEPIFCLGESIGALTVIQASVRRPETVNGIILSSTAAKARYRLHGLLKNVLSVALHPGDQLDITRYIRRYSSEDPVVTQERLADIHARNSLSLRELWRLRQFIKESNKAIEYMNPSVPVLSVLCRKDPVIKSAAAMRVLRRAHMTDSTTVMLPDKSHIIMQTQHVNPEVVRTLKKWIVERAERARESLTASEPRRQS